MITNDRNLLQRLSISAESSDSSPLSTHWTKDRSTSDPCSSRSSVHELDKPRDEDENGGLGVVEEVKEDEARVNRKVSSHILFC